MKGMKAATLPREITLKGVGKGEEKEGRKKTGSTLGIYLKKSQQNVRAETVSQSTEGRHRSEGFLGTIKFLWWRPRLGRQGTKFGFRVLRAKRWCLWTYRDWSAQESHWGRRKAGVGGPQGSGVILGLGAVRAWLTVQGTPTAAVASAVLVVVELRVISGRQLGAAIQEAGERVAYETHLGGWGSLFVLWIICCSVQVP